MTAEQTKRFKYWQWRTIIGTMIGYAIFYFVRKNFSFAIPGLTAEYGISKTTFGVIMTLVGLIYGVSKFVNGVLADRTNGRWHMVTGLSVCSVINFIFGCGAIICAWITGQTYGTTFIHTLVVLFGVLLILNNMFQGCGFPPCNRLITHWVPAKELATKMSIWTLRTRSALHHRDLVRVSDGPHGYGYDGRSGDAAARRGEYGEHHRKDGRRFGRSLCHQCVAACRRLAVDVLVPAAIAVLGVIFIIVTLRDTPKSVGLPELEGTKTQLDEHDSSEEFKAFLRKKVFLNPMIWGLAVADFFVYIVRFAVLDWGPTFLQESRGLSSSMAGWTVAIFEVCGITGMLLAGWISDKFFGGRAQRTCVFCMAGVILFISLFFALPESTDPVVLLMMLAVAGFFIYGPQALIGVIASNHATKKAASTANGVVGMVSYVSVVVSGWGFGFISDHFGWRWVFITMIAMAVLGFLVLLSMWNTKSDGYEHDAAETN